LKYGQAADQVAASVVVTAVHLAKAAPEETMPLGV